MPVRLNRRLTHQLIGGDPDRERKSQSLVHLPPNSGCDILRGTEEPARAGEIKEGMAIASRLNDWSKDPEDLV
jgi:hypothetical protein